jgi:hypothetical protein
LNNKSIQIQALEYLETENKVTKRKKDKNETKSDDDNVCNMSATLGSLLFYPLTLFLFFGTWRISKWNRLFPVVVRSLFFVRLRERRGGSSSIVDFINGTTSLWLCELLGSVSRRANLMDRQVDISSLWMLNRNLTFFLYYSDENLYI